MTAPLKTIEGSGEIAATMSDIGRRAKAAARVLALAATAQKDRALAGMASAIRASKSEILAANTEDLADGKTAGLTAAMIERLTLNDQRVEAMAEGLDVVRGLADPVGRVTESWTRPNGMTIERVKVPLGVVGMMLQGLDGNIDVIVPRGGKNLVARVQSEARVPVFAHLEGVCHVYVDKAATLDMAKTIVMNAKLRRTGVCGAAETLLVDRAGV